MTERIKVTPLESAKESIRHWMLQQKGAKRRYERGEIDKEEWIRIHKKYALMIEAVQIVFSKADRV